MRILHTADWHLGKRLGRHDRMADHLAVLDEIVDIADTEAVDLVIVAGDLFDRPTPPIEALGHVLDTLKRLASADRPVVAIAGNHDSPELFDLLAPLLKSRNVHLVGRVRGPEDGGLIDLEAGGESVVVACLPFPRRGRVIDFLRDADRWTTDYAENLGRLCRDLSSALAQRQDAVKLLTAHLMVSNADFGAGPRGERRLHLGELYATSTDNFAASNNRVGPQYVALGHVHAPQELPAPVPTSYSGSPLELDFGEAGERKQVVLIDVEAGGEAAVRSHELRGGRRLRRERDSWEVLIERDELYTAYLDLTILTEGPDPSLAERARQEFPFLVKVRAEYERPREPLVERDEQPWDVLYADYFRRVHEAEPSDDLLDAFRDILDLAGHATD